MITLINASCSAAKGRLLRIGGRMRPRRHEEAHRSPRGKRPPVAKRNEPITPHPTQKRGVKWLFTKMQGELLDHSLPPHHHRIVQCSEGWSTPADRRADETPQARGGSSLAPRKAATRRETERTHHTPTQLKDPRLNEPITIGKLNQNSPKTYINP